MIELSVNVIVSDGDGHAITLSLPTLPVDEDNRTAAEDRAKELAKVVAIVLEDIRRSTKHSEVAELVEKGVQCIFTTPRQASSSLLQSK